MAKENDDDALLTVVEAAELLRLKPSTIRSWILKRKLSFVKLGSRVFIRRKTCLELIERNVVGPTPVTSA